LPPRICIARSVAQTATSPALSLDIEPSAEAKEELFVLTVTRYLRELHELLVEVDPDPDPVAALREASERFTGYCLQCPAFLDCALSLMRRPAKDLRPHRATSRRAVAAGATERAPGGDLPRREGPVLFTRPRVGSAGPARAEATKSTLIP
jgi:hypothetical protein